MHDELLSTDQFEEIEAANTILPQRGKNVHGVPNLLPKLKNADFEYRSSKQILPHREKK
jgi:hypothetical protein